MVGEEFEMKKGRALERNMAENSGIVCRNQWKWRNKELFDNEECIDDIKEWRSSRSALTTP